MKLYFSIFFIYAMLFFSCSNEQRIEKNNDIPSVEKLTYKKKKNRPTVFITNIDYLRLRERPGAGGEVVVILKKDMALTYLDEMSDFSDKHKLRGIWFEEPWVKVKTEEGKEGWVFAGALSFAKDDNSPIALKLLDIRLSSFFGNDLKKSLNIYRKGFATVKTSRDFAEIYKSVSELRDKLEAILNKKIIIDKKERFPDLSWVEKSLPGFTVHYINDKGHYYIFKDFGKFFQKSNKTLGKEDDNFFDICIDVFCIDNIEYLYPCWTFDTKDKGKHSLLGKNEHFTILEKMNAAVASSSLFEDEIEKYKLLLIDDIVNIENTYWFSKGKILKELDKIIDSEFGILSSEDIVALRKRRKMFENPEENAIKLNYRSGIYE